MPNEKKDGWDKLEVLTKVFSGIVLVVIGFIIKGGADRIAQANEEGQIIQKLISDLTAQSNSKNDIALLTLEHYLYKAHENTIEGTDQQFLLGIAESILNNQISGDSTLIADNQFSLKILQRYDSVKFKQFLDILDAKRRAKNEPPENVTDVIEQPPIVQATSGEVIAISSVSRNTVYIQYADGAAKDSILQVQQLCKDKGWSAPGIEYVSGKYGQIIKYFNPADSTFARNLQNALARQLKKSFRVLPVFSSKYAVPAGQVEVWIGK